MMDNRKIFQEKYPYYYAERQRRYTYETVITLAKPYEIDECLEPTQVGYGPCVLFPPPQNLPPSLAERAHRLWWLLTDISQIAEGLKQNQKYFIELGTPFIQTLTRIAEIDHVHSKIDISVWDFTGPLRPISTGPLSSFR